MRSVTLTMLAVAIVSEHDEHTQAQTVQTLRGLNETAIAHAKALDPRRFTELVAVHQELIEKIAAAERRVLEHDREQTVEHAVKALKAALDLVSYVPPERRSQAIAAMPESMQPSFLQVAATAAGSKLLATDEAGAGVGWPQHDGDAGVPTPAQGGA
jgi:hypothetical protein